MAFNILRDLVATQGGLSAYPVGYSSQTLPVRFSGKCQPHPRREAVVLLRRPLKEYRHVPAKEDRCSSGPARRLVLENDLAASDDPDLVHAWHDPRPLDRPQAQHEKKRRPASRAAAPNLSLATALI